MPREYGIFELGGSRFGFPLASIQEVIPIPEVTPVPLSPPWLRGASNLRGHCLSLFAIERFLNLPADASAHVHRVIVFSDDESAIGVLVERVDTGIVFEESIQPHPLTSLFPALDGLGEFYRVAWQTPSEDQFLGPDPPAPTLVPDLTSPPAPFAVVHDERLRVLIAQSLHYDELLT